MIKFNVCQSFFSVTFYSNITALIGIAVLLNVVCMSMAREKKYNSPPKFLKNTFSGFIGQILCLGNYYHQVSISELHTLKLHNHLKNIYNCEYNTGGH